MRLESLLAAFVLGVSIFWTPPDLVLCPFRAWTGELCPLCGLTHALCALVKGHISEAVRLHALSPLVAGLLVLLIVKPSRQVSARRVGILALLFLLFGVLRIAAGRL